MPGAMWWGQQGGNPGDPLENTGPAFNVKGAALGAGTTALNNLFQNTGFLDQRKATRAYNQQLQSFLAGGGQEDLMQQFIRGQKRAQAVESAYKPVGKVTDNMATLLSQLRDPRTFNLQAKEGGGYRSILPDFKDPAFANVVWGKEKGKVLKGVGSALSSIPNPYTQIAGAAIGAAGRYRGRDNEIINAANRDALQMMLKHATDPASQLMQALTNEKRAGAFGASYKGEKGEAFAAPIIAMLRDFGALNLSKSANAPGYRYAIPQFYGDTKKMDAYLKKLKLGRT